MATPIRHIRSSVAGKIPTTSDVDAGMLAINVRDGKLYTAETDGSSASIVRLDSGTIRGWRTGYSYKAGDVALVAIDSKWKLYRAASNFSSTGSTFPGGQSIGVEWEEIAPAEATGGNIVAGQGLSFSGTTLNVNSASNSRIQVNANDVDLATSGVTPGTYDSVTVDAYGRATNGSTPDRAGAGLTQTGLTLDVVGNAGRIVVNANDVDLATAGTAGTYRQVTTDAYGRVTSGANPTTLTGYGIVDAQPLDATLTALANLATAADQLIYATGSDAFALTTLTSFARSILDDLSAAAARATLELGTIATQNADNVSISGGTISGVSISGGTVDNTAISRSSFAEWTSSVAYSIGDFVLATYEDELRAFKALTNHTSSGTAFPGDQSLGLPSNGYVGDWREISPLRGTFGPVSFGQDFSFSSSITPPTLTASVNDYAPTGIETCNFIRLSSSTNVSITGLVEPNPVRNQALFLCNVGTSNITIPNESASSVPGNRFLIGGNKTLQRDEGILLIYDDVSERWRSQAIQI